MKKASPDAFFLALAVFDYQQEKNRGSFESRFSNDAIGWVNLFGP